MSRIPTPSSIDDAPEAARPALRAVERQLGRVPNMFRHIAKSPAALDGYLALSGALANGRLAPQTRERIALAVAEVNGCSYCLSAHSHLARNLARLDEAEIAANPDGTSQDAKAAAAVQFAVKVARERGHVDSADLVAPKAAGHDDSETIEIVLHVALNTWTNFINEVAATDIDFSGVRPHRATNRA